MLLNLVFLNGRIIIIIMYLQMLKISKTSIIKEKTLNKLHSVAFALNLMITCFKIEKYSKILEYNEVHLNQ